MDKRVKERITGAVVLVAIIVVLVPEMFGGRAGKPAAPAVDPGASGAPGEGPPLRSYTIEVEPRDGTPRSATAPTPPVAEVPPAPASAPARTATPPPPPATPMAGPPAPDRAVAVTPAPRDTGAVPAASARAGGWYVQVGVFAQRGNAERFSQDVGRKGYGAHVDAITNSAGKELFRVRVGPASDRDAAAKLQSQLGSDGFKGTLAGPT